VNKKYIEHLLQTKSFKNHSQWRLVQTNSAALKRMQNTDVAM